MANWCSNSVIFKGDPEKTIQLGKIINEMDKRCDLTQEGVIPLIQECPMDRYYFNIYNVETEEEGFISFNYETKWGPNQDDVMWLATKFGVSFELSYEESSDQMYGQYKSDFVEGEDRILEKRELSDEQVESCWYFEDKGESDGKKYKPDCTEEEWEFIADYMEDYEQMELFLEEEEWENVN